MSKYKKGDDFTGSGSCFRTYGINVGEHRNKIEVYGDAALRDLVLVMLQDHEEEEQAAKEKDKKSGRRVVVR